MRQYVEEEQNRADKGWKIDSLAKSDEPDLKLSDDILYELETNKSHITPEIWSRITEGNKLFWNYNIMDYTQYASRFVGPIHSILQRIPSHVGVIKVENIIKTDLARRFVRRYSLNLYVLLFL